MDNVVSPSELLRTAAERYSERLAVIDGPDLLTFGALYEAVDGVAVALQAAGVTPRSIVTLEIPSSVDFVVTYLAALRIGACVSAVNLRLGASEQSSILERLRPQVRVVAPVALGSVPSHSAQPALPADVPNSIPIPIDQLRGHWTTGGTPDPTMKWDPTETMSIVWTSGTTGIPKGACYSLGAMHAISNAMGEWTAPKDCRLLTLPFAHVGFMTRIVDELRNTVTMVVGAEPWDAVTQLSLVESHAVTVMGGVPTQWETLLRVPHLASIDFRSLRVVGIGAAPASPELIQRIRATFGCPILHRYTSTEAGITCGTHLQDPPEVVAHTIGTAAPGVELRILQGEEPLPAVPGAQGELLVRSNATMSHYFEDPAATTSIMDAERFLHTGDLVHMREDGNLVILGRTKEMYIRGGYNVYPIEVERRLLQHPAITAAAVIGIPNERLGDIGVAVVSLNTTAALSLAEVRTFVTATLADYKAPDDLLIVDALPLTSMGKIDRVSVREQLQQRGTS